MIPSFKMLLELREPSSWPKRIQIPSLFWEEKSRNAGNSSKPPKTKRKKQEKSFKDLKMRLQSFIKLSSKDLVFPLDKTILFTSLSVNKKSLRKMLNSRKPKLMTLSWLKRLLTKRSLNSKLSLAKKRRRLWRKNTILISSKKKKLSSREIRNFSMLKSKTLRRKSMIEITRSRHLKKIRKIKKRLSKIFKWKFKLPLILLTTRKSKTPSTLMSLKEPRTMLKIKREKLKTFRQSMETLK